MTTMQQWNDGHRSAHQTNLTMPMPSGCPHVCWRQGEAGGEGGAGQDGDVFLRMVIMQFGSWSFFWRHDVGGSMHNNSY